MYKEELVIFPRNITLNKETGWRESIEFLAESFPPPELHSSNGEVHMAGK